MKKKVTQKARAKKATAKKRKQNIRWGSVKKVDLNFVGLLKVAAFAML